MIVNRPIFHLLGVTLEAKSAHGVHTGHGDLTHDSLVVRDANGLPAIPASSLAGVLRHAYERAHGKQAADQLFGFLGSESAGDGQVSWLSVDWALVHDSANLPHEGLYEGAEHDPLLSSLQETKPIVRQRVRLNARGCASDHGKFDVTLLPAGLRYTAWISYWCDGSGNSQKTWQRLISLLDQGELRLGHGTRQGYGLFQIIRLHEGRWDLRDHQQFQGYLKRPRLRKDLQQLDAVKRSGQSQEIVFSMPLQAESYWRIGGGETSLLTIDSGTVSLLPVSERRVIWQDNQAEYGLQPQPVLTGSAVKGALRHRVAYHYRCLTGLFADELSLDESLPEAEQCPAVTALFGFAQDDQADQSDHPQATAGLLIVDDVTLDHIDVRNIMHNRVDRFTGGVINGALFTEQVLWQTPLVLKITVLPRPDAPVDPQVRQALFRTLEDVAQGRLPLGAGGSRGLGVFCVPEGQTPSWSDGGQWIEGVVQENAP